MQTTIVRGAQKSSVSIKVGYKWGRKIRFGHWLTLCTLKIHLLTNLLT